MFAFSISGLLAFFNSAVFLVGYISNNSLFPEPLSSMDEKKYLELMKNGDDEARNILIERNLRLVAHVCKKYSATKVDQDDLISIGSIGLIKGINSFDSSKGVRLATYVSRCIDNEILMYLRSTKISNLMFCPIFNDFGFCRAGEKRSTTFAASTELAGTGTYQASFSFTANDIPTNPAVSG